MSAGVPISWYLILSAVLFALGVAGFLLRRNVITVFMSIELMLNAVNLSFITFSYQLKQVNGHIFSFFVMVVAAAEAAVGLAIILTVFKNRSTLEYRRRQFDEKLMQLWLIPVFPLAGFLLNGIFGRRFSKAAINTIAIGSVLLSFGWVLKTLLGLGDLNAAHTEQYFTWIQSGSLNVGFDFTVDRLTAVMLLVVTGIGSLIHIYSIGYMAHEDGYYRFFAYLNLFMFFMLTLVLAANYLVMFVGWEGVGLCSYLLIGFYFDKKFATNAGNKAFIVNRIGDFGFSLAMFLIVVNFGSLDFGVVFTSVAGKPEGTLTAIAFLLLVGACGKSAQIPLYVWLPDAMAGPTPVSALIHAATMVTAGVYMVARSAAIYTHAPAAMEAVAIIGLATAFFAATIGLAQNDIKKVFAYSTVSQLGYMFLGAGVGAFSAGIYHLVTHAFFKALLFLGAGSVIHALGGEQDVRNMGGLRKKIPWTFWTMMCASVAIAGVPPFAGFYSKDAILAAADRHAPVDVLGGRDHGGHDRLLRFPRDFPGILRQVSRQGASA